MQEPAGAVFLIPGPWQADMKFSLILYGFYILMRIHVVLRHGIPLPHRGEGLLPDDTDR